MEIRNWPQQLHPPQDYFEDWQSTSVQNFLEGLNQGNNQNAKADGRHSKEVRQLHIAQTLRIESCN